MLGQANQMFVLADLDYRRERITAELFRMRRPQPRRWPASLLSPRRNRPQILSRPMPTPHHATSH